MHTHIDQKLVNILVPNCLATQFQFEFSIFHVMLVGSRDTLYCVIPCVNITFCQGILKGEVSLYCWPPVWLFWNQLYDYRQFLFLFVKQTDPNQSNRRSMVQWYFPFSIPSFLLFLLSWFLLELDSNPQTWDQEWSVIPLRCYH
jgi:hypothetical protein